MWELAVVPLPVRVSQCCQGLQLGYPWVEVILLEHHVRGTLNGILWEGRNEPMTPKNIKFPLYRYWHDLP